MPQGNTRHIRCRTCGRSVTSGMRVCPRCGHSPLRFHSRLRTTSWAVILGIVAGVALFPFTPRLDQALAHPAPAATPLVFAALVRSTFTPTQTPTPLPTATPTASPTPTTTPSPTSTAARVPSPAPTATATTTPTPRPTIEPPRLLSPPDQKDIGGEDAEIVLQWEGALIEGQQFAVTVRYVARGDETKTVGSWLKATRWRIPNTVFKDIHPTLRAMKWDVTVIDAAGNPLSAPSDSRIFIWHP